MRPLFIQVHAGNHNCFHMNSFIDCRVIMTMSGWVDILMTLRSTVHPYTHGINETRAGSLVDTTTLLLKCDVAVTLQ